MRSRQSSQCSRKDQTNLVGTTATFAVEAQGAEPLAYQWQRNGWNLGAGTNCLLVLTNLRPSDTADYSAVVTNVEGAVTSRVAHLTVASPPSGYVKSMAPYQRMAVYRGSNTSFTVISSGTPPLSFQWQFEGQNLLGETNKSLAVMAAQPQHEGDYSVCVSNWWGSITSAPARLFVTPPPTQFVKSNFIDEAQQRLPYFLLQPDDYSPARSYPLVCVLHGTPGNENMFQTYVDLGPQAIGAVYASYRQQQKDPAIVVWPTRRSADSQWTAQYIQQVLELLSQLCTQLNVDTNRIYVRRGACRMGLPGLAASVLCRSRGAGRLGGRLPRFFY